MNSRLLKTHLPVESVFCCQLFLLLLSCSEFLSLCSYPSLLFIFVIIKTYKVFSCVSLAPAM